MTVLVACASKRGSTEEIARAIASTLQSAGLEVDVRAAGDVAALDGYDAVVIGSAVYMKRWQGDAKHFLRRHGDRLASLPFWVFSSGPVGDPSKTPDPEWLEPPRIVARAEALGVREHVVFGGRIAEDPHGPIERSMAKSTPPEFRDRRDWGEIAAWAARIAAELGAVAPSVVGEA